MKIHHRKGHVWEKLYTLGAHISSKQNKMMGGGEGETGLCTIHWVICKGWTVGNSKMVIGNVNYDV